MKIWSHWFSDDGYLKIQIVSENQQESCELVEYANSIKLPVKSYGKVDKSYTWLWIEIPVKSANYRNFYFGNDKDVVK